MRGHWTYLDLCFLLGVGVSRAGCKARLDSVLIQKKDEIDIFPHRLQYQPHCLFLRAVVIFAMAHRDNPVIDGRKASIDEMRLNMLNLTQTE